MILPKKWQQLVSTQSQLNYFVKMLAEIDRQRAQGVVIYPSEQAVFKALSYVDIDAVKVVILGQDPYHGPNQANGLAFSVNRECKIPPSLRNIFKELSDDVKGFKAPEHGDLTYWAEQGVLLLNTVLTVQQAQAHSHSKLGWETFSDAIISTISEQNPHCVFMLWGSHAQQKGQHINQEKHCVLKAAHPSPLSAYRGFFGCTHFSRANTWLEANKIAAIDWHLQDSQHYDLFD